MGREDIVPPEMNEQLERIREFEKGIKQRSSTRVEPFEYGTAYFNTDFPVSYAHNQIVLSDAPGDLTAAQVKLIADRILGGAGCRHRFVELHDEELGARLRPGLEELGYGRCQRLVVMVHGRDPEKEGAGEPGGALAPGFPGKVPDTSSVEVLDFETVRPARLEMTRGEPWADSEATVEMLVDRARLTAAATNLRHFAIRDNGVVVSVSDLYTDGRTAQVEEVGTLEEHRGRGYARAIVWKAVEVAYSEGHDLVWLMADDDDWPKELYAKLGFDPIGRYWEFIRPADDGGESDS
jgi:GNAT superfamily N-acetyltransferase